MNPDPTFSLRPTDGERTLILDDAIPASALPPKPKKYDPHADWDRLVGTLREAIMKARAGKESPVINPIPNKALDEYGRPLRYAKDKADQPRYAFDAQGRLSLGTLLRHGKRIKRHYSKKQLAIKELALTGFKNRLRDLIGQLVLAAEKEGKEFEGIPANMMSTLANNANKEARRNYKRGRRAARYQARMRHRVSRRINFGLLAGNADRRAHAGI